MAENTHAQSSGTQMLKKLILLFILSTGANATSFSADYTDLWWNPAEDGWGVNVIQQGDTLFATLFVYSTTDAPSWYVASGATFTGHQAGAPAFSGKLYQASGPWFGGAFNPAAVGLREVGTATFSFTSVTAGTLTYSVDGVTVNKDVTRQTWRVNNLAGVYIGATMASSSGCPTAWEDEEPAMIDVEHAAGSISITTFQTSKTCTYSGAYQQMGRMGTVQGSVWCTNGAQGTFTAFELEGNTIGMTGRGVSQFGGDCNRLWKLGGVKR